MLGVGELTPNGNWTVFTTLKQWLLYALPDSLWLISLSLRSFESPSLVRWHTDTISCQENRSLACIPLRQSDLSYHIVKWHQRGVRDRVSCRCPQYKCIAYLTSHVGHLLLGSECMRLSGRRVRTSTRLTMARGTWTKHTRPSVFEWGYAGSWVRQRVKGLSVWPHLFMKVVQALANMPQIIIDRIKELGERQRW